MITKQSIILFFFLYVSAAVCADAQAPVYESGGRLLPEQAVYDVHFYELDLKVDPADSTVSGHADIYFAVTDAAGTIALALDPRLAIQRVDWLTEDTLSLNTERSDTDKTFFVRFPEELPAGTETAVRVYYGGRPKVAENPPWDGGFIWETTPSGDPWIGVACQMAGAWIWWPNKDHPSDEADSVSVHITLPENLTAVSNGQLRGERPAGDGWKTWHWFASDPVNNYNVTLNAAPYQTISESYRSVSGDEMEMTFWVLPEYLEEGEKLYPQFREQMRFLEQTIGPYPFRKDKYGVVHTPYLGMEHQTVIAYGAGFENGALFGEAAAFDDLHQHELAHEWWGNLVTARDWSDFWIHEGIGTYMQPLYAEHLGGEDAYHEMMAVLRERISGGSTVAPEGPMTTREMIGGDRGGDVYYKGAWFMHTLRYVIGKQHFFGLLTQFAYPRTGTETEKAGGSRARFVSTDDLMHLAEEITGMELGWLFDIYLRQPELPRLKASRTGGTVILEWVVPEGYDFPMPIEVSIGGDVITLIPENKRITFQVSDKVVVEADPDQWILKDFDLQNQND